MRKRGSEREREGKIEGEREVERENFGWEGDVSEFGNKFTVFFRQIYYSHFGQRGGNLLNSVIA